MKIEIISTPEGPPPLWIRKLMVGLKLPVIEPSEYQQYASLKRLPAREQSRAKNATYPVAVSEILKLISDEAAIDWFRNCKSDTILFVKIYCRQVF